MRALSIAPTQRPDHKHVMAMAELLASVARATRPKAAERRMDRFLSRVEGSVEAADAAFAAAQVLRDMQVIDAGEAAFVFQEVYACWEEKYQAGDPVYRRARKELDRAIRNAKDSEEQDAASR